MSEDLDVHMFSSINRLIQWTHSPYQRISTLSLLWHSPLPPVRPQYPSILLLIHASWSSQAYISFYHWQRHTCVTGVKSI
jgi:hypothetical protein